MMNRGSALLVLLALAALVAAPTVAAQPADNLARIGFVGPGSPSNAYDQSLVEAFRRGLREVGLIENRNVVLDVAWISSEPEAPQVVNALVQRGAPSFSCLPVPSHR